MRASFGAGIAAVLMLLIGFGAQANAACKITSYAQLQLEVSNGRFLVDAEINNRRVKMIIDTGSFATLLFSDSAKNLGMGFSNYINPNIVGVGGYSSAVVRTLKSFKIDNYLIENMKVGVLSSKIRSEVASGVIGQDILAPFDLEFDVQNGVLRLLKAADCSNEEMPYWATNYLEAPLLQPDQGNNTFLTAVTLNGRRVEAEVDSGSSLTVVSAAIASEVGGVRIPGSADQTIQAVGSALVPIYRGRFKILDVGGESEKNILLPVGDLYAATKTYETGTLISHEESGLPRMLLGADFLKSNRVLLSRSHKMMFFTYQNTGAIFGANAWRSDPAGPSPPVG